MHAHQCLSVLLLCTGLRLSPVSTGHADADAAFVDRYDCMGYGYDSDERTSDD